MRKKERGKRQEARGKWQNARGKSNEADSSAVAVTQFADYKRSQPRRRFRFGTAIKGGAIVQSCGRAVVQSCSPGAVCTRAQIK
jgi:hypothetical protein